MAQLSPTDDGRGGRQRGGVHDGPHREPPIQLPREKPMFTKLVTKSRGAIVMAGVAASIGLGVASGAILAPAASPLPVDHQCDRLIQRINAARAAAEFANERGDYEQVQINLDNSLATEAEAENQGCHGRAHRGRGLRSCRERWDPRAGQPRPRRGAPGCSPRSGPRSSAASPPGGRRAKSTIWRPDEHRVAVCPAGPG